MTKIVNNEKDIIYMKIYIYELINLHCFEYFSLDDGANNQTVPTTTKFQQHVEGQLFFHHIDCQKKKNKKNNRHTAIKNHLKTKYYETEIIIFNGSHEWTFIRIIVIRNFHYV